MRGVKTGLEKTRLSGFFGFFLGFFGVFLGFPGFFGVFFAQTRGFIGLFSV
jgi:hypothetical protein